MRKSRHSVSLGTFGLAFAIALSPVLMQTPDLTCEKTGDTTLSVLEVEVAGHEEITFSPSQRTYDAWVPLSAELLTIRALSTDPAAQVLFNLSDVDGFIEGGLIGVGGGEVAVAVPVGESSVRVSVKAPGGAIDYYVVTVFRSPPEPTDLVTLEVWVPEYGAENRIADFHPRRYAYNVGLTRSEDTAVLLVDASDTTALITVEHDSVPLALQWGQLAAIDVPGGTSELVLTVSAPPDSKSYVVHVDRGTMPPAAVEQFVDDYVAPWLIPNGPGLAVTVMDADGVDFEKSYGMANIEQSIPIGSHTPFELASLSKQFTATAAMMLYEEGRLHPDDLVLDLFPEGRPEWAAMTIHHLLTHQSGLSDHIRDRAPIGAQSGWTNEDVLAYVLETPLEFPPGERFEYSNSGYVMMALAVERVSGQLYEDFLQDRIFTPLGMVDSSVPEESPPDIPNRAAGYLRLTPSEGPLNTMGDVGQYSSLGDLQRWEVELRNATLVSPETLALMFSPHVQDADYPECHYGYGWFVCDGWKGLPFSIDHTGRLYAYSTSILRMPEEELTIIMLSNGTFATWIYDLAADLGGFYLGYEPAPAAKSLQSLPACDHAETAEPIVTPGRVLWPCE